MRSVFLDLAMAICLIVLFFSIVFSAPSPRAQILPRVDTSVPWCWSPAHGRGLPCHYKSGEDAA